jgi:hypothetical protein
VAGTYDAAAGKMELFIDGRSMGTTKYVKTTCQTSQMGIGGVSSAGGDKVGNPFRGRIDEVRLSTAVRDFVRAPAEPYATDDRTVLLLHFMAQARAAARTPQEKERVALFEQGQWKYMRKGQP